MPFKDFDAARRERKREPISFVLGGHTFACVTSPALGDIMELVDAPDIDLTKPSSDAVKALIRFIKSLMLSDADAEVFDRMLYDKEDPIEADALLELGNWLSEQYSGRPTGGSTGSATSPEANGSISNPGSSSPAEISTSSA